MLLVYVDCLATPNSIHGMFTEFVRNATFGALFRVNLNLTDDKKFLFSICLLVLLPVLSAISIF